jgi:hypothetical protein
MITSTRWPARAALVAAVAAATLLGACTGMRTVTSQVSSFGDWPADRKPGRYAFDRLPSQQARSGDTEALEAQVRGPLEKVGFIAAEPGQEPDVLVQIGAQDSRVLASPWDDPLWWRGGYGGWRHGPWGAPRWGGLWVRRDLSPFPSYANTYEREVALLIRDRASGKPLFESHATSEGVARGDGPLIGAMFEAALNGFPKLGENPRHVDVIVAPDPAR